MVIEPLYAFFLLEGILFGAIGGTLIVNGLLNFDNKLSIHTSVLQEEIKKLQEESGYVLSLYKKLIESHKKKETKFITDQLRFELKEFEEESISIRLQQLEIISIHTYNSLIGFLTEKQIDQRQVRMGLPFLIGGFLLQAIGVIVQLY